MLEINKILQLKDEYLLHNLEVGEGMFWLFNIETGDSFKLNETSYQMLSLLDGNKSIEEAQKFFLEKYPDSNPDEILKDFMELLEKMEKENILIEKEHK